MRLFVAVYPSAVALEDLATRLSSLAIADYARTNAVNARLANIALWHLTMAFIGEVPDSRFAEVAARVDAAAAGSSPSLVCLAGGGRFGKGKFTTVWVGLSDAVAAGGASSPVTEVSSVPLAGVAYITRSELKRARVPYDHKPFRPHLTIARPGDRVPHSVVDESVLALGGYRGPAWEANSLCLVASQLGPNPVHEVVHRAPIPPGVDPVDARRRRGRG